MAIRRPFTIQYARERVARELWASPIFLRTNYVITAVWALVGAVKFTAWYPERKKNRCEAPVAWFTI